MTREEIFEIFDEHDCLIGTARRSECHGNPRLIHRTAHVVVYHPDGRILLQRRSMDKDIQPGKWDTAVGGHISFGEDLETALRREAYEEIGLEGFTAKALGHYRWDTKLESELVYYFISYDYAKIRLHSEEVVEGKFWSPSQIEKQLGQNLFTPNFEYEYQLLKNRRG